jgi:hypothetical protein
MGTDETTGIPIFTTRYPGTYRIIASVDDLNATMTTARDGKRRPSGDSLRSGRGDLSDILKEIV